MGMYSCGPFIDGIGLQNSQNTDIILHISVMWKESMHRGGRYVMLLHLDIWRHTNIYNGIHKEEGDIADIICGVEYVVIL